MWLLAASLSRPLLAMHPHTHPLTWTGIPPQVLDAYAAKKQRAKNVPQSMLEELRAATRAVQPGAQYPLQ